MIFFRYIAIFVLLLAPISVVNVVAQSLNEIEGVEIAPKEINLGEVKSNQECSFWLYNNSKAPVVVTSVMVDCSCTKVEFGREPIMVGDSLLVGVKYMPRRDDKGVFYKTIRVYTSQGDEPIKAVIRGKNI